MEFWEYNEHTIDGKGRLVLPSSFRDAFAAGGVLTNQGRFIALQTPAGWDRNLRRMKESGEFSPTELAVVKSYVTRFQPDSQNRVTVPSRLRQSVGLDREVSLIGMGDHVAIYPRERWLAVEGTTFGDELADRLEVAL